MFVCFIYRKMSMDVPVSVAMQVRLCQFQMRIVWSSDALTIQGLTSWN